MVMLQVRIEEMRTALSELAPRVAAVESRKAAVSAALRIKCEQLDAGVEELAALGDPTLTSTESPCPLFSWLCSDFSQCHYGVQGLWWVH